MAAQKKKEINLLPQEEFAASTLGRVLTWLLGTFRVIVIATEIVVMAAFLSRFYFDARNTDLSDEIKQKGALIGAQSQFEKDFRAIQKRLSVFAGIASDQKSLPLIEEATSRMPPGVVLAAISADEKEVQIKAAAADETSIAQFIVNLEASENFSEVELNQVDTAATDQSLVFVVRAKVRGS